MLNLVLRLKRGAGAQIHLQPRKHRRWKVQHAGQGTRYHNGASRVLYGLIDSGGRTPSAFRSVTRFRPAYQSHQGIGSLQASHRTRRAPRGWVWWHHLHRFTDGRYAAAWAARYGPSLDVYGPVWGWLQPVKSQEACEPLSPVQ